MAAPTPTNRALYSRVKTEAKRKFKVWPSAYGSKGAPTAKAFKKAAKTAKKKRRK